MPKLNRFTIDTPRWLFLFALICAPWVYGSTPPWAVVGLEVLLGVILALWLATCALRGLKPAVHPVLLRCVMVILAGGWLMTLNPHFRDKGDYQFEQIQPRVRFAPGTVDQMASVMAMVRVTCLLGVICFICDLSTRREWRRWVWQTMAATGVSVVLFGLVQSAFAQPILFWSQQDKGVPYFATYYYHGNAGSFINLVLPLVAGLAAMTLGKPDAHAARAIWVPGLFICVAGAFVNLSRSAMAITSLICVVLLCWQFIGKSRDGLLPRRRLRVAYEVLMIVALVCLIAFSGWERPMEKWAQMEDQLNGSNKRLVATKVCLRMLPDAGWHGFGPGTFALVFPHYTGEQASLIPGIWRYAHDDYLQTVLEWGWVLAIFWGLVFFGGTAELFLQWKRRYDLRTADRVLLFVSGVALVGVAMHAVVDFPLQIASLQLYAAVFVGMGWASGNWEGAVARQHS